MNLVVNHPILKMKNTKRLKRFSQLDCSASRQGQHAKGFITRRWLFLGSLLLLSLLGALQVATDNESEAAAVPALTRAHRPSRVQTSDAVSDRMASPDDVAPDALDRAFHRPAQAQIQTQMKDVFTPHSWYVPPAPVAVAESAPTPPPLPFVYLGKLLEEGKLTVFLARQDKNFTVKEGDLLDDNYRVDVIKGSVIELTYMPLNMKQTLLIGEKN